MSYRSSWKLPFINPLFFSQKFTEKKSIKTAARSFTVPFLPTTGRSFYVYNGQKYIQVIYKREMAGLKLGSFAVTKSIGHVAKDTKKKNQKRVVKS